MGFYHWESALQPGLHRSEGPTLRILWSVVARNIDRVRCSCVRAHASSLFGFDRFFCFDEGAVPQAPPGDEMMPATQHGALSPSPPSDSVDSALKTRRADGSDVPMHHVHTPKRSGSDLDASPPQWARTTAQDDKEEGDNEFRARHGLAKWGRVRNFAVAGSNFDCVFRFPVLGWPAYDVLFGVDGPGPHVKRKIVDGARPQNLRTDQSFIRQAGTGPLSAALGVASAEVVPQYEFRTLDERGGAECLSGDFFF